MGLDLGLLGHPVTPRLGNVRYSRERHRSRKWFYVPSGGALPPLVAGIGPHWLPRSDFWSNLGSIWGSFGARFGAPGASRAPSFWQRSLLERATPTAPMVIWGLLGVPSRPSSPPVGPSRPPGATFGRSWARSGAPWASFLAAQGDFGSILGSIWGPLGLVSGAFGPRALEPLSPGALEPLSP